MLFSHLSRNWILKLLEEDGLARNALYLNSLPKKEVECSLYVKTPMALTGLPYFFGVFEALNAEKEFDSFIREFEGESLEANTQRPLFSFPLPFCIALSGERLALNLLQRSSSISTYTRKFLEKMRGSNIALLDTRKTTPGLRSLEKYAVAKAGGLNHRFDQEDMWMVKDNHKNFHGGVRPAVEFFRSLGGFYTPLIVEVHNLNELAECCELEVGHVMLDNFSPTSFHTFRTSFKLLLSFLEAPHFLFQKKEKTLSTPAGSISKTLGHFPNLKVFEVDGTCPIESYAICVEAEKYIRKGKGPVLLHAHVTRPYSHSMSDDHKMYRTQEELEEEKERDVLTTFPELLTKSGLVQQEEMEKLYDEIQSEVREAMKKAIETPWPEVSTATQHVFSEDVDITSDQFSTDPGFHGKDDLPMAQAINSTLKSEVKRNPLLRVFGEDVADFSQLEKLDREELKGKGGVFSISKGVQREALPGQVFNSPLAEANIVGRAIGMAMRGLRPVVEIQFFDYIWTAYMQLKNEMATTRYRSGGDFKCPMVVRVPIGGYLRGGAMYHSQCGESLFTHIPGICVAFPSNAADAAGLLRTAMRADDPVMFLEHKHLYYQGYNRSQRMSDDYMIPFGKARVASEGKDITVLCWGALVQKSLDAAKEMAKEGVSVEVIDARTLVPFDMGTLKTSLAKTNRLLVAHEETKTSGFAGEIAARVNEECFELLDAPIKRVTAKDSHIAYCPQLEEDILPQVSDVVMALRDLARY